MKFGYLKMHLIQMLKIAKWNHGKVHKIEPLAQDGTSFSGNNDAIILLQRASLSDMICSRSERNLPL